MRKAFWMLSVVVGLCILSGEVAWAQPGDGPPPGGEEGDGPPPPRWGRPPRPPEDPIRQALDANHDGELSAEEISNAAASLKKLDKNNDGKLSRDELRPPGPPAGRGPGGRRGRRGGPDEDFGNRYDRETPDEDGPRGDRRFGRRGPPDGPPDEDGPPDGPGRFGPGRGGAPGGPGREGGINPQRMVQHAMDFDNDEDGKLDREELTAFAKESARHEAEHGPPRRGPRGGFGPKGPGAGLNPEQMVKHAMEFDKDGDGKLSRQEFMGFAKECAKHAAGGGPGGRGPGGPRPHGPRPDGPPPEEE